MKDRIPKDLWLATQFACKMIRENGYFNKDCKIAANYYGVKVDDVMAQVRKRQSAGQKRANANAPKKKMKWFVLKEQGIDECESWWEGGFIVCKGFSEKATENRFSEDQVGKEFGWNCGQSWATVISTHSTKEEAVDSAKSLAKEKYGKNWKYEIQVK